MAVRIPTFADLGFDDPRSGTPAVQYPQSDPAAAALGTLGQGIQQAGAGLLSVADEQEEKRQRLNQATADTDFASRFIDLHTKIALSTDPNEIKAYKQQLSTLPQISAQAIDDPYRQKLWAASHIKTLLQGQADADERLALLGRQNAAVDIERNLDSLSRAASSSPDSQAFDIALQAGQKYVAAAAAAGLTPQWAYEREKQYKAKLLAGTVDNLISTGNPDRAVALLDSHPDLIDQTTAYTLRTRANHKNMQVQGDAAANWALGLGPKPEIAAPASGGKVSSGDAVDQFLDLAEAKESGGRNIEQQVVGPNGGYNPSVGKATGPSTASGNFQITDTTWKAFAPKAGVDIEKYPRAIEAPYDVQRQVARTIATTSGVQHWTNFNSSLRSAVQAAGLPVSGPIQGQQSDTAAADNSGVIAFGDSIAAHLIRKAGVAGQESGKVGAYDSGDTAVSGYNPSQVLTVITNTPDDAVRGKNVVLSTGTSNDPKNEWKDSIPAQIALLKSKGATSVTVMGVGTKYADRNAQLAQIAQENGAAFSGPLRKVASDGIHSSDPKAELAAVQQAMAPQPGLQAASVAATPPEQTLDAGGESAQPSAQGGGPQLNRTGLPSLTEQYNRIQSLPLSLEAKQYAWAKAKEKYSAMEADAARAERTAAQQQKQQDEQIEGTIIADAGSPNPKWTAQGVMTDQRLSPEARTRMVNFLSSLPHKTEDKDTNTYGRGFYDAFQAIHAPDGDPNKITSPDQLYGRVGPNGDLTVAGLEKLRNEIISKRTPEGEAAAEMKKQFLDGAHKMISGADPLLHIRDPKGEELYLKFLAQALPAYEEGLKKGKSPAVMFNPDSPDYLGKIIPQFKRSPSQMAADFIGGDATPAGKSGDPASYATPDALKEAVRSGAITYEAGVVEAQKRGYIPAPPQVPLAR